MNDIFSFVIEEEAGFTKDINLDDEWYWNFKNHIRRSFLYKNSQFSDKNSDRKNRPFKNIIRPILNIHYRTEGFDVKDVEIYVDNPDTYYKSFLIKKFYQRWALEQQLDTFIDELVESYVDYGGVLVKNVKGARPEVVNLRTLAFCDQTDILSGAFAIKHYFSASQLRDMAKVGWGNTDNNATVDIETLISKAEYHKQQDKQDAQSETPSPYIEVYEVHGTFPSSFIGGESDKHENQIHIIAFQNDTEGKKIGVTLFANREPVLPFKFLARDNVQGRALGFGAIEELFEAQVWTNFSEIANLGMLKIASKTFFKTTDPKFKNKNNIADAENGQVFDLQNGADFAQVDNYPRNSAVFEKSVEKWEEHANVMGAASDLFLGQQPTAGTPFKSVETQLVEGKSLHRWRQGKIATFVDEIHRDWIIPYIAKELSKGQKFLAELSSDEIIFVADKLVENQARKYFVDKMFSGQVVTPEEMDFFKEQVRSTFEKGGSKRFLEILKKEMDGEKLDVRTNIAGKQKNLDLMTDKVVNILRQFIATPQIRQDPEMIKLLNTILESSGLSPIMFGPHLSPAQPQQAQQQGQGGTQPLKDLGNTQQNETTQ